MHLVQVMPSIAYDSLATILCLDTKRGSLTTSCNCLSAETVAKRPELELLARWTNSEQG